MPTVPKWDPPPEIWKALVQQVESVFFILDEEGRYRFLSQPARAWMREVRDEDPETVLGRPLFEVFPEFAESPVADALRRVIDGSEEERLPELWTPRGNCWSLRISRLGADYVLFEAGEVREARRSQGVVDRIIADFPFGAVATLDRERRYTHVGGRGFEQIDVRPEDLLGRSVDEVWEPHIAEPLAARIDAAFDGRSGLEAIEYAGRTYEVWTSPVRTKDGTVESVLLLTVDISRSVRLADEIRLIRKAVNSLELGVTIADATDPDHPMIWVNDGFEKLTGYPPEEVTGRNCRFLQGEGTASEPIDEMRQALQKGVPVQVTLLNYRKSGEAFWNRVSIYPVHGADRALTHFIGIQEDVTVQRQMGMELERGERLRSLGQLAGGMAHDIRNVLTGIGGLLEMTLERDDLPEAVERDLEEGQTVIRRGTSVTNRLLTFARREIVDEQMVDLNAAVRERTRFFSRVLRDDVPIRIDPCDDEAWVSIDTGQFDQVLLNLIKNAEQAMPDGGGITLTLRCGAAATAPFPAGMIEEDGGPWVRLTVSDEGIGMDFETRHHAFDPFFTTKRDVEGTGLGLPSVYGAVTQAGGHIHLDSSPGEGTAVHLVLPRKEPPRRTDRVEHATAAGASPARSLHVLLIEDDETVRRVCRRALERVGHRVDEAADGRAGLELLEELDSRVDLLVTDAVMPEMSGIEVVEAARKGRPDFPVILMSGYTAREIPAELRDGGFSFLEKPFSVQELLETVARTVADVRDDPES